MQIVQLYVNGIFLIKGMMTTENIIHGQIPLQEWLFSSECQRGYLPVTGKFRNSIPWIGKRYIQAVTSELMMIDYDWKTETIHLKILSDVVRSYEIASPSYVKDKFTPIALIGGNRLLIFTMKNNEIATFHIINLAAGPVIGLEAYRKCGSWSLDAYFKNCAFRLLRVIPQPHFGCAVSNQGRWVVIWGPKESFMRKEEDWGCKLLDAREQHIVKPLYHRGFKWVGAACFNPSTERSHLVAMVGVSLYEFVEDFSRPNTTGTLVSYDLTTDSIVNKFTLKSVSTEILRFNRTGDLIFVRTNSDKKLCVLNANTLVALKTVDHDVSNFSQNHYSYSLFYRLFPLVNDWDEYMAVVQWDEGAMVEHVRLPILSRTLLQLCRLVVCKQMASRDRMAFESLQIPASLIRYLLWS